MNGNVLLITPPLSTDELFARGSKITASVIPQLGLAFIAAVLEKDNREVEIVDGIVTNTTLGEVVKKASSFDYIGITALSSFTIRCIELIKAVKSEYPQKIIVVGGAHVTSLPRSLLDAGADYAVIGEGEETIVELLRVLDSGNTADIEKVRGIAYIKDDNFIKTEPRPPIKDLDQIPLPARHLLPMHLYKTSIGRSRLHPSHSMITSRGCPGKCTFCNKNTFGNRFRMRSPERIVEEMILLKEEYGAKEVAFWDDNFTTAPKKVLRVCELIMESDLNIPWGCEARIDCVNEEMLIAMKKANCRFISYGVESGSNNVLTRVNKRISTEEIERVIRMTQKIGIPIRAYFMLGFIDETEQEMFQTINFAKKLNPDIATFTLMCPFPGTEDYEKAKKQSESFDPDFYMNRLLPEFNFLRKPVYTPPGMTPERLIQIHKTAYHQFFFRPGFLLKQLSTIRRWSDIVRLSKGFLNILIN